MALRALLCVFLGHLAPRCAGMAINNVDPVPDGRKAMPMSLERGSVERVQSFEAEMAAALHSFRPELDASSSAALEKEMAAAVTPSFKLDGQRLEQMEAEMAAAIAG